MHTPDKYIQHLESKIKVTEKTGLTGITVADLQVDKLKPHQQAGTIWSLEMGRCGLFFRFGLGKTRVQCEWHRIIHEKVGGQHWVIAPIGTIQEFTDNDGPVMGVNWKYVEHQDEVTDDHCYYITNYDKIRLGKFDLSKATSVSLDEGSVLRHLDSETTEALMNICSVINYRMVATATPSPNEHLELINYAHFLGVMDRGQAMTRFFQRNSQKAGDLQIHSHHKKDFWLWIHSWSMMLSKPSILGFSDEGYELPGLNVHVHKVDVPVEKLGYSADKQGQMKAFADAAASPQELAKIQRASIPYKLEKMNEILDLAPNDHVIIWHLLEDERKAINKNIENVRDVYGSMDRKLRKERVLGFARGEFPRIATKPEISGSGCNWQHHCRKNLFMSVNDKFEDFIQALHRTYRFLQKGEVDAHFFLTEYEEKVWQRFLAKWKRYNEDEAEMDKIILEFGLNQQQYVTKLKRTFYYNRQEKKGQHYTYVNNDSVIEIQNKPDNSTDLQLTSIPFGNHYEYTALYNDFGHNADDDAFFKQMDFLIPEMLRTLKPGRNCIVHVKDRILYGYQNDFGMYSVNPFSDKTVAAFMKHGFVFMGRRTIKTDVVRENAQTYRLGWSEVCKDSTNKGCGSPEYLLCFRKLPSSTANGYADVPVVHSKDQYSRSRWQIDADSFWRSNGNRLITPADIKGMVPHAIKKWWTAHNLSTVYDYEQHVAYNEALEQAGRLPAGFALIPAQSWSDDVLTDVNYMHGLNAEQFKRKAQNHICPLPFDIVDRVIELFSNPGDEVADWFGGLGTVPYRSILKGRKGFGCELNSEYWKCGTSYLGEAEQKMYVPDLFSMIAPEK